MLKKIRMIYSLLGLKEKILYVIIGLFIIIPVIIMLYNLVTGNISKMFGIETKEETISRLKRNNDTLKDIIKTKDQNHQVEIAVKDTEVKVVNETVKKYKKVDMVIDNIKKTTTGSIRSLDVKTQVAVLKIKKDKQIHKILSKSKDKNETKQEQEQDTYSDRYYEQGAADISKIWQAYEYVKNLGSDKE